MQRVKVKELLHWSSKSLANSSSPDIDVWVLLKHALRVDDAWLISNGQTLIKDQDEMRFRELIDSRKRGIPVAYLTNSRQFWSKDLYIDSRVLVPRPETEILVEAVLRCARRFQSPAILELGTGSGAIAIALSSELPDATVTATDISQDALAVAGINLEKHECTSVNLKKADWFSGLESGRFDLICSNPPYVASGDPHLKTPELQHEPESALIAGKDGLDAVRQIVSAASGYLHPRGWLILEHAYDQVMPIQAMMANARFVDIHSEKDLMGHDRVSLGRRPEWPDHAQGRRKPGNADTPIPG